MRGEVWLFSYGTLQQSDVQIALFGRKVESVPDVLPGYGLSCVDVQDPDVIRTSGSDSHPILIPGTEADTVQGAVLLLTPAELAAADRYETDDYVRVQVSLASGRTAYAYVAREGAPLSSADRVVFPAPTPDLLGRLLPVARRIFTETFGYLYDAVAFNEYCESVYRPGGTMSADFSNPQVRWRVAVAANEPIGYAKLTPLRAPAPQAVPGAMELQQIYVLPDWHGKGVADELISWALATARGLQAREVYLTVFDHNERAKRFYARYGFGEIGRCTFQLGDRVDDDRIWRRELRNEL